MTAEAITIESMLDSDYSEQLDYILSELQMQNEFLSSYLPQIYTVTALLLGSLIVLTVFRLLTSFLGRVFNDTTKF